MWIDETDATQLAQRLRVGPRELVVTIGGPWRIALRIPEREAEQPGTLYVGRAGPTVAILVSDDADPQVTVGRAVGAWTGAGTLQWSLVDADSPLHVPPLGTPPRDVDSMLVDLGNSVDAAYASGAGRLTVCRYCGSLVAPVHAMGDERCAACAETIFGS